MKKFLKINILIAIIIVISISTTVFAENITLVVNGETIQTDVSPYIINGRTMIPIRFVTEGLGGKVSYSESGEAFPIKSITITSPEIDGKFDPLGLTLFINKPVALISEGAYRADVAPIIKNNRTMVQLRFIADYFGCTTKWDAKTRTVYINSGSDFEKFYEVYYDEKASSMLNNHLLYNKKNTQVKY